MYEIDDHPQKATRALMSDVYFLTYGAPVLVERLSSVGLHRCRMVAHAMASGVRDANQLARGFGVQFPNGWVFSVHHSQASRLELFPEQIHRASIWLS